MKRQPIADIFDDLRSWLKAPSEMRRDPSGALRIVDELDESHVGLLVACEGLLARITVDDESAMRLVSIVSDRPTLAAIDDARAAVARAKEGAA